jgi:phosphatidylglycerophosphatase C
MPAIAAFDVDGTVTDSDTVLPYLRAVAGTSRVLTALGWSVLRTRGDRDAVKAGIVRRALAGVPAARLDEVGRAVAGDVVARRLRPTVVGRLRWHLGQGHTVVFVSASLRPYLDPLAAALGVQAVLCTELALDAQGRCTGELVGANCRGAEKVRRLEAWMAPGDHLVAAYGDARSDASLLAAADEGWWVRGGMLERDG